MDGCSPAARRYEELDDFIDIALFDHDEVGKDDRMGRVEIDLRELSREVFNFTVSLSSCLTISW